jgi:uncharacterized membrane protein YedE/YeeE
MLLGLSTLLLLMLNGRVAGISGIFGRLLAGSERSTNGAFVIGLLLAAPVYFLVFGAKPSMTVAVGAPTIILAGLLVGFGTRMGSGCTSGHGILGLARLSRRSIAATLTFLLAGVLVATTLGAFR